jgi:hypothetical protein
VRRADVSRQLRDADARAHGVELGLLAAEVVDRRPAVGRADHRRRVIEREVVVEVIGGVSDNPLVQIECGEEHGRGRAGRDAEVPPPPRAAHRPGWYP